MSIETLTPQAVENTMLKCLFADGEDQSTAIKVEGITTKFGFNPDRLQKEKENIKNLLLQLPEQFQRSKGGGWTFLNACNDKNGNLWTGFHPIVEQLMCMGIATGQVEYLMPREMWDVLPGGMPYFVINY